MKADDDALSCGCNSGEEDGRGYFSSGLRMILAKIQERGEVSVLILDLKQNLSMFDDVKDEAVNFTDERRRESERDSTEV